MGDGKEQWLGPGETAFRLGVTTKALRVYEREGLVLPHRADSGWRLYGPVQQARLHQIIVLRDLGLTLKSIRTLLGAQSRIGEVLKLQRENLESRRTKISSAIELIRRAERTLDMGRELSLDDLANLTKETIVQQPTNIDDFKHRFEALVAERDPTGRASQAVEDLKQAALSAKLDKGFASEVKKIMEEAGRLKVTGDISSEPAKQMVRAFRSLTANQKRPAQEQVDVLLSAYAKIVADAEAKSDPLPFDPATFDVLRRVMAGMKERGELA